MAVADPAETVTVGDRGYNIRTRKADCCICEGSSAHSDGSYRSATQTLLALIQKGGTDAYYASEALGHQSGALPSLQKAAQSSNPVEQRWVAVALGDMGVSGARQTLEQLAKSSDPDVAYVAKEQLDRMGRTP